MKMIKQKIIFLILIFLTFNNIVFSQQCDAGYTFENGFCKSPSGNSNLHLALCENPGGSGFGSYDMYMGSTEVSPCPAGWTMKYNSYQAITSNSVTLWYCQHQASRLYLYFSMGGCGVGTLRKRKVNGYMTNIDDIRTVTFTATNNLLVQSACWSFGLPQNMYTTWFYEAAANEDYSIDVANLCANDDLNDYESEIMVVRSWAYKETRCAIGYVGPNCVLDNICLSSNGGCDHTCTRTGQGTATCSCNSGYRLNANGKTCDEINECAEGTSGCAHTCSNTAGSFTCSCLAGYRLNANGKSCDEINECAEGTSGCGQICTNTAGSFTCSCQTGYRLNANGKTCDEINECSEGTSGCAHTCSNTAGSFTCSCLAGYRLNANGKSCDEINECAEGTSGCGQTCTNTAGSFTCGCNTGYRLNANGKSCDEINECSEGTSGCSHTCSNTPLGSYTCSCPIGYKLGIDEKTCDEINECVELTSGCDHICTNSPLGSFTCSCNTGYRLNSNGKSCDEIDECSEGNSGCSHTCTNTAGSFTCSCTTGYRLGPDSKTCLEINECNEGTSGCDQSCSNTPLGSYTCSCSDGYRLNSNGKSCDEIDECTEGTSGCISGCTNTPLGSYTCTCPNGNRLNLNGKTCDEINECIEGTSGCSHTCTNLPLNSFTCSCPTGYTLNPNGKTCDDIDECLANPTPCGQSNCNNIEGSYYCSCFPGFSLSTDNQTCNDIDECTDIPNSCQGNSICHNSIGDYSCSCPLGFELATNKTACQDINECAINTHQCTGVATCSNLNGGYECICPSTGYALSSDSKSCNDIDECTDIPNSCQGNSICHNSIGDYSCSCPLGFELTTNKTACLDIDECAINTHQCTGVATCSNLNGGYECICPSTGYTLSSDGKSCNDIDECTTNTHQCTGVASCLNNIGDYECTCPITGYTLSSDGKSCSDIDECLLGTDLCTGEFTTCKNIQGSYECSCPIGFISISNGKDCQDIDECLSSNENECGLNSVCQNSNGSYSCLCIPNYSHVSPFKCEPKPIISTFYQKPIEFNTFVIEGFNFNKDSVITIKDKDSNEVDCKYQSGNSNQIECKTKQGLEVKGNVTIESNTLLSDPFKFNGAPYLSSYSSNPNTVGGQLISFSGRNLPTSGDIKLTINSINCEIKSKLDDEQITCTVPEGSGGFNYIKIQNESVSNTDSLYITYANPTIKSMSIVYTSGGILTVTGNNFGIPSKSKVSLNVGGTHECNNVIVESHTLFTCQLDSSTNTSSQMVSLVVDDLPMEGNYYYQYSKLLEDVGECNCNNHGTCDEFGCTCDNGFTGVSCNETNIVIIPKPIDNIPSIEIDTGNNFGYKVSIIRIEELDFNQNIIESIQLLNEKWGSSIQSSNKWVYNITLNNKSYLEATFQYFKQSTNISFASNSFIIPSESLKLSFETLKWPFQSKLNTLRVVVETDTLILSNSENECSINTPIKTNYNQNVWSTIENPETGIVARFISIAEVDNIPIIANIEILESPLRTSSVIGISVPYFSNYSIIDPDFSVLLTNNEKGETGNCKSSSSGVNWRVATGVSIGAGAAVCLAGAGAYAYRKKKSDTKFVKNINNRTNN